MSNNWLQKLDRVNRCQQSNDEIMALPNKKRTCNTPFLEFVGNKEYNQSASKHGGRTFLHSAMRELVCNGQLWARAALRQLRGIRSNSESILQQQFGENPGNDYCYSIYFDIRTIVWLSRLL